MLWVCLVEVEADSVRWEVRGVWWGIWLAGARPRTWPAAIVPVLVGTLVAQAQPNGRRNVGFSGSNHACRSASITQTITAME